MLRRLADQKHETIKKEDDDTDLKIETKYEVDDPPPLPETITIEDDINNKPESVDEKSKKIGDVIESTLGTATQIEISDADRKKEQECLDEFLGGIVAPTEQELTDKTIAHVLSEETDNPQMDGKIEDIFIDDDEKFYKENMTEKDKEFSRELVDKTNFIQMASKLILKLSKKYPIVTMM